MSVYGPRLELPEIKMPELGLDPKLIIGVIVLIVIILIGLIIVPPFLDSLNPPIKVSWTNNPLDLKENPTIPAELTIILINTTKEEITMSFEVITNSEEILVFCPYNVFPNVEAGNTRKTTCVVRRNPDSVIFTGTYNLTIKSTLGETKTTLEVKTK